MSLGETVPSGTVRGKGCLGRDGGVATTDAAFEHHLMGLDRQIEAVRLSRKMVAFFTSKEVCMLWGIKDLLR